MEKKMTLLNKIKIYVMYSIGAILSLIGLYTISSKRKKSQSIKKTDDAIINNNNVVKDAEEQIKSVDVKKEQVLDLIGKQEENIKDIKQELQTLTIEEPTNVDAAIENIISKTKRRSHRSNKVITDKK
jgi:peptidoglycan hydrolase CwlO-like protein